jgi:predicted dehydrogenase
VTPIKIGVVGCGDVAQQVYLPDLARMQADGRLRLAALADLVPGRAEHLAAEHGAGAGFTEHVDLLAADVDLVVNLTHMQAHGAVSLDAIAAGKHVYSEKPFTSTLEEAGAVMDAARAADVVVGSAPALLCHADVQKALRWLRGGLIGRICFARGRGSHPGPDRLADFMTDPSWFFKAGAGPLFDLGIYPLHVLTGALGSAKRVTAFSGVAIPDRTAMFGAAAGTPIPVETDDNTHLMLDFGNATFAYVDATFCVLSSKGPRMEFYGESGVMNLASSADEPPVEVFQWDRTQEFRGWTTPEAVYRGRGWPPAAEAPVNTYSLTSGVTHMVDFLEGRAERLLVGPEHATHVLEIMLAAQESAARGTAVELETSFEPPF